jgi:DNA-binding GntR family transcriptional regulator
LLKRGLLCVTLTERHRGDVVTTAITGEMASRLASDRTGLAHASTADRVAGLLRTYIMEGLFPPGSRLPEEVIGQALGVSRNTLRESFRLLRHERLAVHQMNRGTFVPVLSPEDVIDLYRLRRLIEGGAAREAGAAPPDARTAVKDIADSAAAAAAAGQWLEVRTADLRLHLAVAALAGSPRLDELMRCALAELRLVFHATADPEQLHGPYVARNSVIAEMIVAGDGEAAQRELLEYLDDAERQILDAYRAAVPAAQERNGPPVA